MSFSTIKDYFRGVMTDVDTDLREWVDAFNIENVPSTVLDKSWHLAFQPFIYRGTAQTCFSFDCPVTLSVIFKGYRTPQDAVDTALQFADSILRETTKSVRRLNQPSIKNVLPGTVSVRPLAGSNDNDVVLEIQARCEVFIHSI